MIYNVPTVSVLMFSLENIDIYNKRLILLKKKNIYQAKSVKNSIVSLSKHVRVPNLKYYLFEKKGQFVI